MHLSVRFFLILTLTVFSTSQALAREIVEQGISVKALGMGNAYLSSGTGHDAIWYNPAGFATLQGVHLRLLGIGAGLNGKQDSYDKYSDLVDTAKDDMSGAINSLYGDPIWGRTDFQASLSLGSFIFGAFGRGNVGLNLQNPAFPNIQSSYFLDYGAFVGYGAEVIPEYLDMGATVRRFIRYGGDMVIGASDLAYLDSERIEEMMGRHGTGYSADFGMKLKAPVAFHPSVSAVWQNIGKTSFSFENEGTPPPSLDNDISLGIGLEEDLQAFVFRFGLDYRHSNLTGEQIGKKFHTGIELDFPMIALRGGFSQGYYTAGASIDLWFFQVDAATYAVELGEYPGQEEDRRYIVQLTIDLGFDSAGNLISLTRKQRSGIKQRR